jgi:hypothetical protein
VAASASLAQQHCLYGAEPVAARPASAPHGWLGVAECRQQLPSCRHYDSRINEAAPVALLGQQMGQRAPQIPADLHVSSIPRKPLETVPHVVQPISRFGLIIGPSLWEPEGRRVHPLNQCARFPLAPGNQSSAGGAKVPVHLGSPWGAIRAFSVKALSTRFGCFRLIRRFGRLANLKVPRLGRVPPRHQPVSVKVLEFLVATTGLK